jgi:hypothetical protein
VAFEKKQRKPPNEARKQERQGAAAQQTVTLLQFPSNEASAAMRHAPRQRSRRMMQKPRRNLRIANERSARDERAGSILSGVPDRF